MPMKMKNNMKGINLSCASTKSTAICSSIDQHSMIKNTTKSIQRLNTFITTNINPYSPSKAPCISELPFNPRPSSFSSYRDKTRKLSSIVSHSDIITRRRSSADINDIKRYNKYKYSCYENDSTSHSSRYLLGESKYLESLSKCGSKKNGVKSSPVFGDEQRRRSTSRIETRRFGSSLLDDNDDDEKEKEKIRKHFSLINVGKLQSNAGGDENLVHSSTFTPSDKVVVLRVSLHCKGCEAKLRKHLSKMEGVTSFSIDIETKKVTVRGNVTPSDVLTSISRVKNAQFWPPQPSDSPTSSSTSSSSSTMDFN